MNHKFNSPSPVSLLLWGGLMSFDGCCAMDFRRNFQVQHQFDQVQQFTGAFDRAVDVSDWLSMSEPAGEDIVN